MHLPVGKIFLEAKGGKVRNALLQKRSWDLQKKVGGVFHGLRIMDVTRIYQEHILFLQGIALFFAKHIQPPAFHEQ